MPPAIAAYDADADGDGIAFESRSFLGPVRNVLSAALIALLAALALRVVYYYFFDPKQKELQDRAKYYRI